MFNLDPAKLLVILVVALIVLGPERLPRVARQLGAAWRELTRVREQLSDELRAAIPDVEIPKVPYRPGSITNFLNDGRRSEASTAVTTPPSSGDLEARVSAAEDHPRSSFSPEVSPRQPEFDRDDPSMN